MLPFQCLDGDPQFEASLPERYFLKEELGQIVTAPQSLVCSQPASTGDSLSVSQLVHK